MRIGILLITFCTLRRTPKDPDLLFRTARAYRALGNFPTAIERYEKAAQMLEKLWEERPEDLSSLLNLRWCKLHLGQWEEAERIFRLCLSYHPGWREAQQGLNALSMIRELQDATREKAKDLRAQEIASLRNHLRYHPQDAQAHLQLGILSWDGKFLEAADRFRRLHQGHPQDREVFLALTRNLSWGARFGHAAQFSGNTSKLGMDGYLSAIGFSKVWTPQEGYQDYRTFSAGVRIQH